METFNHAERGRDHLIRELKEGEKKELTDSEEEIDGECKVSICVYLGCER
jgi:hypothetical protein